MLSEPNGFSKPCGIRQISGLNYAQNLEDNYNNYNSHDSPDNTTHRIHSLLNRLIIRTTKLLGRCSGGRE